MKKNIVIYWCDFRGRHGDLLSFLGSKKKVYLEVFNEISKKENLILVFGKSNYLGDLGFKNYYLYQNGSFVKNNKNVQADSVLDRSRTLEFPETNQVSEGKVLNQLKFKELAADKWLFYQSFAKYSPKTILCNDYADLKSGLKQIEGSLVVIKPRFGMKGEDIFIGEKKDAIKRKIRFPILLQEFVETKGCFKDNHRHDIRVVVIDGKIVYSVLRRPVRSEFLANVAQGGSIEEVPCEELPFKVVSIANEIATAIKTKYNNPFYSIDFGVGTNGPVIFEINNFIGFPLIERNHKNFVKKLSKVLIEKANLELT